MKDCSGCLNDLMSSLARRMKTWMVDEIVVEVFVS